ncbi:hypothetical protein J6590_001222 [Homalodisca vitripennis]|nr:hypothetical protein J6590_001222 [Homalodisca vitripennis]
MLCWCMWSLVSLCAVRPELLARYWVATGTPRPVSLLLLGPLITCVFLLRTTNQREAFKSAAIVPADDDEIYEAR